MIGVPGRDNPLDSLGNEQLLAPILRGLRRKFTLGGNSTWVVFFNGGAVFDMGLQKRFVRSLSRPCPLH